MIMRCSHCGVCCHETEMLLSEKDIIRLQKRGFNKKHFVRLDRQGYAVLKNMKGYCVFYDRTKRRCIVYSDRPAGCRFYPVIVDEDAGIILDSFCPERCTISEEEKNLKGKRVVKLLKKIDSEAVKRLS